MSLTPEDRFELRDLVDAYATVLDERDSRGFVGLFTDDGHLGVYEPDSDEPLSAYNGAAELENVMEMLHAYGPTMHLMANHRVRAEDDGAAGVVYCLARHLTERDGKLSDLVMTIRYVDRYRRTGDGWRIAHRKVVRYWNELRDVVDERVVF